MGHRLTDEICTTQQLLADFFNQSTVGLAIYDDDLRYQALNPCLAEMHGVPMGLHLGRSLREVLGEFALRVEPVIKHVLSTGQPVLNFEIAGALPTRKRPERWIESFLPAKDAHGRVRQVGVVIVQLMPDTQLRQAAYSGTEMLRSWKEIAGYLGACVKTVQRWEHEYKFPIRRLRASKGAMVFALKTDVDNWLRSETLRSDTLRSESRGAKPWSV
jgi:PAS fold